MRRAVLANLNLASSPELCIYFGSTTQSAPASRAFSSPAPVVSMLNDGYQWMIVPSSSGGARISSLATATFYDEAAKALLGAAMMINDANSLPILS